MKHVYLFLLFLLPFHAVFGQGKPYTEKDYARSPLWIGMIKDTATNFFEARKAFDIYFKHHTKPAGEQEDIGERPKREKQPSRKELKKLERDNKMRMEVKKYQHWRDMVLPYVQPDGSILTPSQRLLIHQQIKN
jgi:hypothetical protein